MAGYMYTYFDENKILIKKGRHEQTLPLSECADLNILNVGSRHDMVREMEFLRDSLQREHIDISEGMSGIIPMVLPHIVEINCTGNNVILDSLDLRQSCRKAVVFYGNDIEIMDLKASPKSDIELISDDNNTNMVHTDHSTLCSVSRFYSTEGTYVRIKELDNGVIPEELPCSDLNVDMLAVSCKNIDITGLDKYAGYLNTRYIQLEMESITCDSLKRLTSGARITSSTLFGCMVERFGFAEAAGMDADSRMLTFGMDSVMTWRSDRTEDDTDNMVYESRDYLLVKRVFPERNVMTKRVLQETNVYNLYRK